MLLTEIFFPASEGYPFTLASGILFADSGLTNDFKRPANPFPSFISSELDL